MTDIQVFCTGISYHKLGHAPEIYLDADILKTIRDRGWVPLHHQEEIVYGESNGQIGHMIDNATWPTKVKIEMFGLSGKRDGIEQTPCSY